MRPDLKGRALPETTAPLRPGPREFIVLMALLTSLEAFAIDAMLPALPDIGADLGAAGNAPQLVIGALFLGAAFGQFVSGALSDALGRRPAIFIFIALFLAGSALCMFAESFQGMLAGRVLQGFGAAGPHVVSIAIIRDRYEGRGMARIFSFVMGIFIMVPVIAPGVGQAILFLVDWRGIFGVLAAYGVFLTIWFAARQPETLKPEARVQLSFQGYWAALRSALRIRSLLIYTGAQGLILGAFIGYLSSSQQIFQDTYGQGALFPLYFGSLAVCIGLSGAVNGVLVMRFGMRRLSSAAFVVLAAASFLFWLWASAAGGAPPFWATMAWLAVTVFCVGVGFGNLSALALDPLGDQAGMGATLFGGGSTLIALPIGALIGLSFDGGVGPLAAGFVVAPFAALLLMRLDRGPVRAPGD